MSSHRLDRRAARARYGLLLALVCLPRTAAADEVSGTFTGDFEARGNYYLERSTRVMMPAARVQVYTPNGIKVRASYVLDVISSASIAQTGGDKDGVHTELRHGIGQMGVSKKFDLGSSQLDIGVHGTYSTEPDYKSWVYGVWSSLELNEKNTTLMLGFTRVDDSVFNNTDPTFEEALNGNTLGFNFEQLLSPVLKLDLGYQLSYMSGFLGNPYRRALVGARTRGESDVLMGGLPVPENPPDERWRHNLEAMVSWYIPSTSTALQLYLRGYTDDWGIQALTPEPRVYQQLGRYFSLRLRYRFYTQDRAWFAPADGQDRYGTEYLPSMYDGPLTNDPKMYRFHSHQLGLRLGFQMAMLNGTSLAFLRSLSLDLSLDRGISTSTFGDYWVGTLGGRVLF